MDSFEEELNSVNQNKKEEQLIEEELVEETNVEVAPEESIEVKEEVSTKSDIDKDPVKDAKKQEASVGDTEETFSAKDELPPHATMKTNPRQSYIAKGKTEENPLGIVSATMDDLKSITDSAYFEAQKDQLDPKFIQTFSAGIDNVPISPLWNKAISNAITKGIADYVQEVENDDKVIKPVVPKWSGSPDEKLTGLKAVALMQRALGQGSFLKFPCWASGVWLTLRAPTVFELADYEDLVSQEVIELGKQTNGAIFNNTQVHLNKHMIDLAERLLYKISVNEATMQTSSLRDILLIDDLETIAWALSVIMYPNGFPYEEACVHDIEKCTHVVKETLNLSKIFWVNKKRLTKHQIEFMANDTAKRSMDEIHRYRSDGEWYKTTVNTHRGFKVYIKTPTVAEHIDSGYRWIEELEDSIRDIATNGDNNQLNRLIYQRAGLTFLRGYAHYISSIVFDDGSRVTGKEDLDAVIKTICASPDIMSNLTDEITNHIANNSITMCAINRFKCPVCKQPMHPAEEGQHPHLIPLSALKLFFNLRDRKLLSV